MDINTAKDHHLAAVIAYSEARANQAPMFVLDKLRAKVTEALKALDAARAEA